MSVLCISMFCFLLFISACVVLFSQNPKYQKYSCCFSLLYSSLIRVVVLFLLFISSCSFTLPFWFSNCLSKTQKYFPFSFVSSLLCFKIENTKNICCSSWFCLVLFRFNSRLWLHLELGFHFISFKLCKWKAIMTIFDNLMWWEAGMNHLCFHFCTYTCFYDCTS